MHHSVDFLTIKWVQADDLGTKNIFNDHFDRSLCFAIGVGPRWGVCRSHNASIRVNSYQDVIGRGNFTGQISVDRIGDGIRDCFDGGDLHASSIGN